MIGDQVDITIIWHAEEPTKIISWTLDAARIHCTQVVHTGERGGAEYTILASKDVDLSEQDIDTITDYYLGYTDVQYFLLDQGYKATLILR